MILHLLWKPGRPADPLAEQQLRLERMLAYARQRTRFYREQPAVTGLAGLPTVELLDYLRHPERYEVAGVAKHPRQDLEYPLSRPPRTAVLGQEMRGGLKIRNFAGYRSPKLAQFAPESLAAPSDTIRALAQSIEEGEVQWRPLRQALIVFTDVVRGALSEEDRDYFWRVFQVPIFEQFRGFAGELLAQECEAHEGMHIHVPNVIFERAADGQLLVSFLRNPRAPLFRLATNLTGEISEGRCECGQSAPRLLGVRRRPAQGASSRRSVAVVNSLV